VASSVTEVSAGMAIEITVVPTVAVPVLVNVLPAHSIETEPLVIAASQLETPESEVATHFKIIVSARAFGVVNVKATS
jgi:hypothetical protein